MSRRLILPFLTLCGILAISVPAAASAAQPAFEVSLRVMSSNIHSGIGSDSALDLARTANAIRGSRADVVGLQEVDVHWSDRSEFRDQAEELAEQLGMWVYFAPIYDLPPLAEGQPRRQYGVAVLSRYPIVRTVNHWITRLSTQEPNPASKLAPGFAEAVVLVRGALVHVYTTHLDYRPDSVVRKAQVADTLRILGQDRRGAAQLLLGDFNAEHDAPELAPLWNSLQDAWSQSYGPGSTYPAEAPAKRIDFVTASKNVRIDRAQVVTTLASDHRPVLAEVTVRRDI